MATADKSSGRGRTRNFATVIYPESAPDNWYDILVEQRVPILVSPLHDKDINPTGEPKKPHYHIILMFENVKYTEQAREVFDLVGGVGCETVKSLRGYARYLCHLDNPEKAQYNIDDVKSLCGADYADMIGLPIDNIKSLCEMEEFCERYNVVSFYALARYASLHRSDWSRVLKQKGSIYMREYLQSRKWSIENNAISIIDPETGEKLL